MINRRYFLIPLVAMLIIMAIGCDSGLFPTPIGNILKNPRDYDGKIVHVKGQVTESFNLLLLKYFKLKDDTGEIVVVTDRILPKQGTSATVKGHVQEAFSIGDVQCIVIVEESENDVR